jgi:putative copper resistance protein D
LIELSHVPLALAGMTAGAARWLELRLDGPGRRVAGWMWPAAFVVVGVILLAYREA